MNHSYFKQPTGTYKTLNGFSMGDCSKARGSELILRISELKIFKKLRNGKNLTNITKYLRFRDDVSIHLNGSFKEMMNTINTICTGYPKEIIFNMETKIIQGKFLNIRVINFPKQINPMTSVLRKPNNKYNITPPNSNVSWKFKKMAGVSYFHTARTHCTDKKELQNQLKIVRGILELKGFSKNQVKCMELHKKKDKPQQSKKFISTIK